MKPDANWPTHLINFNVSLLVDPAAAFCSPDHPQMQSLRSGINGLRWAKAALTLSPPTGQGQRIIVTVRSVDVLLSF